MKKIRISDVTMKQAAEGFSLSFKEKIELAKMLDRAGVDVIEIEGIENPRTAVSETAMVPTRLVKGESVGKVRE